MAKENAKDFLPLVQALAEGKTIQHYWECGHTWEDCDNPYFDDDVNTYRIKPEKEYVPFESVDELIECWGKYSSLTMPLIWVKGKGTQAKYLITEYWSASVCIGDNLKDLKELYDYYTFLDGSPIGKIKE